MVDISGLTPIEGFDIARETSGDNLDSIRGELVNRGGTRQFTVSAINSVLSLSSLKDVDTTGLQDGYVLVWNTSALKWAVGENAIPPLNTLTPITTPEIDPAADLTLLFDTSESENKAATPNAVVESATGFKMGQSYGSVKVLLDYNVVNETGGEERQLIRHKAVRNPEGGTPSATDVIYSELEFKAGSRPGSLVDATWTYEAGLDTQGLAWMFNLSANVGFLEGESGGAGFVMFGGNIQAVAGATTAIWWENPTVKNMNAVGGDPINGGIQDIVPGVRAMHVSEDNACRASAWNSDAETAAVQVKGRKIGVFGGGETYAAYSANVGGNRESRAFSGFPTGALSGTVLTFPTVTDWTPSTPMAIGDHRRDTDPKVPRVFRCLQAHTSGAGTFAQDRQANPGWWAERGIDDEYLDAATDTTWFDDSQIVLEEHKDGAQHATQILTANPNAWNPATKQLTIASGLPVALTGTERVSIIHRRYQSGAVRTMLGDSPGSMNRYLGTMVRSTANARSVVYGEATYNYAPLDFGYATLTNGLLGTVPAVSRVVHPNPVRLDYSLGSYRKSGAAVTLGFTGANANDELVDYGDLQTLVDTNVAGAEAGSVILRAKQAGTMRNVVVAKASGANDRFLNPGTDQATSLGNSLEKYKTAYAVEVYAGATNITNPALPIGAAPTKATPVNADEVVIRDSVSGEHMTATLGSLPGGGGGGSGDQILRLSTTGPAASASTGVDKDRIMVDAAFTLKRVYAYAKGQPTGGPITIDVNIDGVSALTTKITIDAGTNKSTDAAVQPVIGTTSVPANGIISANHDAVGLTNPGEGVDVYVVGTYA